MKKRFSALLLSLCVLSGTSTCIYANSLQSLPPIVSSVEEGIEKGLTAFKVPIASDNGNSRYLGGYYEYKNVRTKKENDKYLGYHPDFPGWMKTSGYWFSTKTTSWSIGGSYNTRLNVSINVGVNGSTPANGFWRKATESRYSRPYVTADVTYKLADMYTYDEFNNLLNVVKGTCLSTSTSDVQYFVDHK